MSRKLYALFILVWAISFLVLIYMYFFVYYTATIKIDANVSGYSVELFSKSTAQKWSHQCPEKICTIEDVSPFEYNISIVKENYESEVWSVKISPRRTEEFIIQLEKKVELTEVTLIEVVEWNKEKIQRLRDEKLYYKSIYIDDTSKLTFSEYNGGLQMHHRTNNSLQEVSLFDMVGRSDISMSSIIGTEKIFLTIWKKYYIFDIVGWKLHTLPFKIKVLYIKPGKIWTQYLIVTEKGTFIYDIIKKTSVFQYLFRDFIYNDTKMIGVIYEDEEQKKENFNLIQEGNLIIGYDSQTKIRNVLLTTDKNIDKIEWKEDIVIFTVGNNEYELKNF